MFYCQFCGTLVPRGVPSTLIITQFRTQQAHPLWRLVPETDEAKDKYPWRKVPKHKTLRRCKDGRRRHAKLIEILVPGPTLQQIAKEKRACPACARCHVPAA